MKPHPLAPLIGRIRRHYQRLRPTVYVGLQTRGELEPFLTHLAEWAQEKLYDYQDQGLSYAQASEVVNEVLFPPSEEDEDRAERMLALPQLLLDSSTRTP